ncbi:MAG: hypothetical protein C0609_08970 [Deltaproteobacteria bacterium]|nr:MAG: hypothetical protein C0609_08970 [Deltaproteobacteria bacterium]
MVIFAAWFASFEVAHPVGDMLHCHTHHHDAARIGSFSGTLTALLSCIFDEQEGDGYQHEHGDMAGHYHTSGRVFPAGDSLAAGLDHHHDFDAIPLDSAHSNDDGTSSHDEIILYETVQFKRFPNALNWTFPPGSAFTQFFPECSSPIPIV